jgi:hypothetical protein
MLLLSIFYVKLLVILLQSSNCGCKITAIFPNCQVFKQIFIRKAEKTAKKVNSCRSSSGEIRLLGA